MGILFDLILYLIFRGCDVDEPRSTFVPFEDGRNGQQGNEPKTDYYPEDFDDFGDF